MTKILLVDDSPSCASLFTLDLQDRGYEVSVAECGTEGIDRTATEHPDLILLDVVLPDIDGIAVCHHLKQNPETAAIPIILMTAHEDDATVIRGLDAGADDYLTKSINVDIVAARIRLVLRAKQGLDTIARINSQLRAEVALRQQIEEVLRISEERYRTLIENIDMGIALIDSQQRVIMANSRRMAMAQPGAAPVAGRHCYTAMQGTDRPCANCPGLESLRTGRTAESEMPMLRSDGSTFLASIRAFPTFGSEGDVAGYVEVIEDVTQRRQAALELARAKEAAEVASRAKSEFLANISHEIRTPLTAIIGFAETLLTEGDISQAPPQRIDAVQTILRNGQHLLQVLNDILDLSKIEAQRLEVEEVPYGLVDVLAEVYELTHGRAQRKRLPLSVEFAGSVPERIATDPTRLRQILLNLVSNAVKFTEAGAVRVVVRFLPDEHADSRIQFDVVDTGIGLTTAQTEQLFRPFIQADSSMSRRFGGTGLGLTISKRLVEMLGGTIEVQSELGCGSTFRVTLPARVPADTRMLRPPIDLVANRPRSAAPIDTQVPPLPQPCRILLAEDAPDNQRLLGFMLTRAGATLEMADNGQMAYEKAIAAWQAGQTFDLVLMDMQMPILDGYQATRRLRDSGYQAPVVALTAHARNDECARCLAAGCDGYATKPITRARLVAVVAQYAAQRGKAPSEPAFPATDSLPGEQAIT